MASARLLGMTFESFALRLSLRELGFGPFLRAVDSSLGMAGNQQDANQRDCSTHGPSAGINALHIATRVRSPVFRRSVSPGRLLPAALDTGTLRCLSPCY